MPLLLSVHYPSHVDEFEIQPDDSPRGVLVVGRFLRVSSFEPEYVVIEASLGSLRIDRGESRTFEFMGVPITGRLE